MYYKLDENKNVIPCNNKEWGEQRELMARTNTKHVGEEIINDKIISTVWLGLDHNTLLWTGSKNHPPHVFETMIFDKEDGPYGCYLDRYSTWKEAEEGHQRAIQWVKDGCKEDGSHTCG